MRTIITLALAAILLTALALPAAAGSGLYVPPSCLSPQVTVTCQPSSNQSNTSGSGMVNIPASPGVIKMNCTMRLNSQNLGIDWSWNPQVTNSDEGIQFKADCNTPYVNE
ncbi:MAG: hypothetical protein KQH53_11095 [Desulfarculaceae bacterium]|nr:hypothetical protein [Desulfarculaceae bacterium]